MRKILTGTTALVAASALAGRAEAGPALQLGISGFYRNSIGVQWGNSPGAVTTGGSFVGYGDNNRTTAAMRQEIRINFSGSTTLDNGITVGLNGENVQKWTTFSPSMPITSTSSMAGSLPPAPAANGPSAA